VIKRAAAFGIIGLAGWYLYQRMTAGNRYIDQGGAQTFPLIDNKNSSDGSILDSLGEAWDSITGGQQLQSLRYFEQSEFGEWWPHMSTELLTKLDDFRHRLTLLMGFDVPVHISAASGSLGRHAGASLSQHNVDMWGEVRAADVMPEGVPLDIAYQVASEVGFGGIGVYPDWLPLPGLHLDVRSGPLALWSGYLENEKQVYGPIGAVLS
jgi:hypothetical protein